jgi:steroid 5-alpha reductase family enzyme
MNLSSKHIASLCGFFIVGVIAFFLAFSPDLVREGHFTLPQVVWIAFVLTIFSFICFLIEKLTDFQEERERKREQAQGDKIWRKY